MKLKIILILNILIVFSWSVSAQSGRTLPEPIPTPAVSAEEIKTDYPPCETFNREAYYLSRLSPDVIIKKLNEYGNCGYRMVKASRESFCEVQDASQMRVSAAGVRESGVKYEYNWFIAKSPGEAQRIANVQAQQGFYFRQKMSFTAGICVDAVEAQKEQNKTLGGLGGILDLQLGVKGAFFLFERKVGEVKKNEYKILDGRVSGKKGELEANKKILDDYVAKGFRPVDLWYLNFTTQNVIIMEKDEAIKPVGDYIFIYQTLGLNKKMTELGREGYQPIALGFVFALLNKVKNEPTGMTYDTIQTWEELEKRLPKWKQSGFTFLANGVSDYFSAYDQSEGKWLFAVPNQVGGTNQPAKDFVFLHQNSFYVEYLKLNNLNPSKKNPLTKEQRQEMFQLFNAELDRLVKEGYKLVNYGSPNSDLFLFERAKR